MATFNSTKFNKDIVKSLDNKNLREEAYGIVRQKVERARRKLVEDFDGHPVTQEILGGKTATNTSGTLGGYGNLYTFIGFPTGKQPIIPLKNYLHSIVKVERFPKVLKTKNSVEFQFKLRAPSQQKIEELTPSPWEGRSWTRGIERGISGLGSYMFSLHGDFKNSRSGKAVQRTEPIRALSFRPIKYISSILKEFEKNIR